MGEVYRARDLRLGRTVALKVLRTDEGPELLHRLDREARAASALNHPNIVHLYDVGEAGRHYVVMEHVEGETLRRRLARGPLPLRELVDLAAQLADGLAAAHRAGIVHRDLKPENLMVTPDGVLKILDFGLAKLMPAPLGDLDARDTLSRHGTRAGSLLGTLEYMSPEQASGRLVDLRTDQFSFGLIVHEMATGRPAFRRDTPAEVLAAVIERDPEPLRRLCPEVPEALEHVVSRCLQKDPGLRYASTDALAEEMAVQAGRSRPGTRTSVAPVAAPPAALAIVPAKKVALVYHVQERQRVRTYAEDDLAQKIRRGKLSGVELVREGEGDAWQPLFETSVYRREVPDARADPRRAAQWRVLRAVGGHFTGFFITSVVMLATQGHLPFWLAIWGAVLAVQALGAIPAAWALWHARPLTEGQEPARPKLPAAADVPPAIADEAVRVRALIQQQGGPDVARMLADVDAIEELSGDLAVRARDLEEQTSETERGALARALTETRERLARAELEQDRRLFERQLEVLRGREETIVKALRVLDRLRVRRELAEHQLKQLRLDLSRRAASGAEVPELSSRLRLRLRPLCPRHRGRTASLLIRRKRRRRRR